MRVMLVDDNYQMLEFLDEGISWDKEGMTLVAKCENGEEALSVAKVSPIDILVTDIDMPKMNGLELIKQLQQIYPSMQSIIISNYDEFKYAQKAIKLLVNDYILKDKLDPESLLKSLHQIIAKIKKKDDAKNSLLESETIIKENLLSIKRQWIRGIVDNPPKQKSIIYHQLLKYGINLDKDHYVPIVGKVTNKEQAIKRFESADLLMIAVEQLLKEYYSVTVEGFVYDQFEMMWFHTVKHRNAHFLEQLNEIQHLLQKYFNIEFTIIYDSYCHNIETFLQSTRKLLKIENEWFFIPSQEIVDYKTINTNFFIQDIYDLYEPTKNKFKRLIMKEERDLAEAYIHQWFDQFTNKNFHPKIIKGMSHKIMIDLYIDFHFMSNQTDINVEQIHFDISSAQSLQQLKECYKYYISKMVLSVQKQRKSYRPEVWEALTYIDENIGKKITLKDISQELYLNPTYFSRLFKKDTGQSFVDYVTKRKMEKAQHLLEETDLTIEVISYKLGYSTSSYFIRQFRQYAGKTPLKYRDSLLVSV